MNKVQSPFKFLDPFTLADRHVFFGRDKESETLYRMVLKTPLLLLYGLSGTGKTSLVQCGLAARFDGPDWLPLLIRRQDNLLSSLHAALDRAWPTNTGANGAEKIAAIYSHFLRPIFLLFDQFEELFILGKETERNDFVTELKEILATELPCTVLLIVREEYLGQLYHLEKEIPTLFDFRMRVEPMDSTHVKEVLSESFRSFNIRVESPAESRYDEIIQNVSERRSGIELPYLQVYLDRLYREDHTRSYPLGTDLSDGQWPEIKFTQAEIAAFGTITDVLDDFVREQREELQRDLEKHFPDERYDKSTVADLLDAFVSDEGTKRPVSITRQDGLIHIAERQRDLFPVLSAEAFTYCAERLETARLLRSNETGIEIAHDSLASVIEGQRSAEQRQLADVRRRLKDGYQWYLDSGKTRFFDRAQIAYVIPFLDKIKTEEQALWRDFITKSQADINAKENAEQERVQYELKLVQEKLEAEKKAKKRQSIFTLLLAGVALIAAVAAGIAVNETKNAQKAETDAQEAKDDAQENLLVAYQSDSIRLIREIEIAERNLKSFRQYGAEEDIINLETSKKDSLNLSMGKLKQEIEKLKK